MNKDQATPRPWKVGFKSKFTDQTRIETADGKCSLANVWGGSHEANARLIVTAVNEYDNLIHLCKWALACMKDHDTSLKETLKQAIAKAGEV